MLDGRAFMMKSHRARRACCFFICAIQNYFCAFFQRTFGLFKTHNVALVLYSSNAHGKNFARIFYLPFDKHDLAQLLGMTLKTLFLLLINFCFNLSMTVTYILLLLLLFGIYNNNNYKN